MPRLPAFERLAVISPHLDDAVFSCGQVLAAHPGSVVVTVFAGVPASHRMPAYEDRLCGFASGEHGMLQRREEDRLALSVLEARPLWLDFLPHAYGHSPAPAQVRAALAPLLVELSPAAVLLPLGLSHPDHLLAHSGALQALIAWPDVPVLAYEDALYRTEAGLLQQRLMALAQAGWQATPVHWAEEGSALLKGRAVKAYVSSLRCIAMREMDDVEAPERCWRLESAAATQALTEKAA